jgi:hypothetical protein
VSGIAWPTGPPTDLPPPPPEDRRYPVTALGTRAGGFALELVLVACTFAFGWVGWWIIAWSDGQSPSKVLLHRHVVDSKTGRLAGYGQMAVREAAGKGAPAALALGGLYLAQPLPTLIAVAYFVLGSAMALVDNRRRALWDRLAHTVVVDGDPPPVTPPAPVEPVATSPEVAGTDPS